MIKRAFVLLLTCSLFSTLFSTTAFAAATNTAETSSSNTILERIVYDEEGNIVDNSILSKNFRSVDTPLPRGAVCCSNVNKKTWYDEQHVYSPPTPAWCVYDRYKIVQCTNCGIVHSYDYVGQYSHVHQ